MTKPRKESPNKPSLLDVVWFSGGAVSAFVVIKSMVRVDYIVSGGGESTIVLEYKEQNKLTTLTTDLT